MSHVIFNFEIQPKINFSIKVVAVGLKLKRKPSRSTSNNKKTQTCYTIDFWPNL